MYETLDGADHRAQLNHENQADAPALAPGALSDPIAAQTTQPVIGAPITSWEAVMNKVSQYEAGLDRQRLPLDGLRLHEDALVVGEQRLLLDDAGFQRLCRPLPAPADYLQRLSSKLRSALINHHFQTTDLNGRLEDGTTVVLSRDGYFRGFDQPNLYRLPATDVLDAVGEGIDGDQTNLEVQRPHLHEEALHLEIVSPKLADEVRVGDVIQYGLQIRLSLLGEFATTVESFALRLRCANGLVQRQCLGHKGSARSRPRTRRLATDHSNAHEMQREQIRRLSSAAWQRLGDMSRGVHELQHRSFDFARVQRFLRQARMQSARLTGLIEAAWNADGSEPTAYGFLNALTQVATHEVELSNSYRRRLELLAGVFAGQDVHLCPKCFSVLSA